MNPKLLTFCATGFFAVLLTEILEIGGIGEFVATVGPKQLPYITIACVFFIPVFSLIFKRINSKKIKIPLFLASYYGVLTLSLVGLQFLRLQGYTREAIIGFCFITQLNSILNPILSWNLISRYFNIFDARKYLTLFLVTHELGAVSGDLFIHQFLYNRGFQGFFITSLLLTLCCGIGLYFINQNRAIQYGKKKELELSNPDAFWDEPFYLVLFAIVAVVTASGVILNYQFTVALTHQFESSELINQFLAKFRIIISISAIFCSLTISRWAFKNLSVSAIQWYSALVFFLASMLALFLPQFAVLAAVQWSRTVMKRSLFAPSIEQISNGMRNSISILIKFISQALIVPVTTLIISSLLLFVIKDWEASKFYFVNLVFAVSWLVLCQRFRKDYLKFHKAKLKSPNRESVIRSLQALGEVGNMEAVDSIVDVLLNHESVIAKKFAILAVGNIRSPKALRLLFQQVYSGHEEIQKSAVDSISNYDSFIAQRFLVDFLNGDHCKSLLVREGLIRTLHRTMGSHLIPLLVPYLENPDARIVANTIQSMAESKDKRIIELLTPYLDHENNRVRANTILVLYKFRETREACRSALEDFRRSEELNPLSSFIYVVGKLRLRYFKASLYELKNHESAQIRINLAFSLASLGDENGIHFFSELLNANNQLEVQTALHHFLQLDAGTRFNVIEHYLNLISNSDSLLHLIKILDNSSFDFHLELDILKDALKEFPPAPALPLQAIA